MAKLKTPNSDTSAARVADVLLRSDLSETELMELARKFSRASSFPQEVGRMIKAGLVTPAQPATTAASFASERDAVAACDALEKASSDAGLTNAQLVAVLLPLASSVGWRADSKSGRTRLISSFIRAAGMRGFHEAMQRLGAAQSRDPFLDGITSRANAQDEGEK